MIIYRVMVAKLIVVGSFVRSNNNPCACMGKNNNGFVYLRLIMQMYVATAQYCIYHSILLTVTFYGRYSTVLCL